MKEITPPPSKLSQFASWPGTMINPQWRELPMSRTIFYGPKDVRAIEVRLYSLTSLQQRRVFGDMRTVKGQISLRICAVWSGLSLSLTESFDATECINWKQLPGWYFVHVQDDLNLRILRMLEGTFSLGVAHLKLSNPRPRRLTGVKGILFSNTWKSH